VWNDSVSGILAGVVVISNDASGSSGAAPIYGVKAQISFHTDQKEVCWGEGMWVGVFENSVDFTPVQRRELIVALPLPEAEGICAVFNPRNHPLLKRTTREFVHSLENALPLRYHCLAGETELEVRIILVDSGGAKLAQTNYTYKATDDGQFQLIRGTEKTKETNNHLESLIDLGAIPFNYLPYEAPTDKGWVLGDNPDGISPKFEAISNAPIAVGLLIVPSGQYCLDFFMKEAHRTTCNRLKFAANFSVDARFYVFVRMSPRQDGHEPIEKWVQMGVNIGPPQVDPRWGKEGILSISGKALGGGWQLFDISLEDAVNSTFGKEGFIYGEHGKLLRIRLRGSLSISPIELYRS
jgi:hypothetical protein